MLPGFRFLFAAIVVSMSILVFGLGAAALLRAAHEQFASTPAWRVAPEATFAQQADLPRDVTRPVLAMLRVEPEPGLPEGAAAVNVAVSAEPAEAGRIATLKPQQPEDAASQAARPDPAVEGRQQTDAAATPTEPPAIVDPAQAAPAAAGTKIASTEQDPQSQVVPRQVSPPPNDVLPVASGSAAAELDNAAATAMVDAASTRIATLGGPPVAIETPPPVKAAVGAMPDRDAVKKHRQVRRAAQRRRLAARARAAARQAQQTADPFSQPSAQSQLYAQPPAAARSR